MSPALRKIFQSRPVYLWAFVAVAATSILAVVLYMQRSETEGRTAVFFWESPVAGRKVFEKKGCAQCHPVNGDRKGIAPDLGRKGTAQSSLPQLVTAMWNHAPQMWERMREKRISYPSLDARDIAQIFSYVYLSRHAQEPGNAGQGKKLFAAFGCVQCHSVNGVGRIGGSDLSQINGSGSSLLWMESIWNQTSSMYTRMTKAGMAWPEFKGSDLSDLYAYVSKAEVRRRGSSDDLPDPERGWQLFQKKSCVACHPIKGATGLAGSLLGPDGKLPPTFDQMGQLMITKEIAMQRAMQEQGITFPELKSREMADIIAFLYSLRYVEPAGSPYVGRSVFKWRGCSYCHGDDATGTRLGPALRGRGRNYNSITLAVQLWRHGAEMYKKNQEVGHSWPTLLETDVGDLLSFLDSPVQKTEAVK
jgi:mono/diheme cytochrome c family protein